MTAPAAGRPGSINSAAARARRRESAAMGTASVSYTHLRAHETVLDLVCRLLLEKKKTMKQHNTFRVLKHRNNMHI